jgi:hypothetical protein
MLLLPPPLHPDETVMVTGDEHGEPALFTIFFVVEVFFSFFGFSLTSGGFKCRKKENESCFFGK